MYRNWLVATSALAMFGAQAGFAQTAAPATPLNAVAPTSAGKASDEAGAVALSQPPAGPETSTGLGEIVVTATRRAVDLQRVAATVEAVPASTLKAYNINNVLQLPSLVAGLVVLPSGGNNVYLRGIGSASTGYNEAQNAVYIDGLYLANPALGILSFNNIDQIEVLKGPQGTLYGRNVTGGLISATTRAPDSTKTRVDASVGYGNFDTFTTNVYASTPLSSSLAANIAVFHQKQSKGWSLNLFTGNTEQKSNETGVETKLQWKPGSDTKITGAFIYDYNNRDFGYAPYIAPGTVGTDGTTYLGRYKVVSRIDPSSPFRSYIGTLKVEQNLGFANLMSLTGYQTSRELAVFSSGSPILGQPIAGQGATTASFAQHNRTYSQELQLTSAPSSSRFDWVAGAFYYNDHTALALSTYNTCVNNVCAPGFTPTTNTGYPNTLSGSVYGDGTFRLFKATRLTVGLRYTAERKTLSGFLTPLAGQPNSVAALPPAATAITAGTVFYPGQPFATVAGGAVTASFPSGIPTKLVFHKLTYRFVLAQDIGDNVHLYASHNLGFKSGAFNANVFTNVPARPELLYATEAGLKSELFDRRVRINLSYFHYTYKDVQLRSQAPPAPPGNAILQNAAKELFDGVDGDFSVAVTRQLTLGGSLEYLNARFADFPGTTISIPGTRIVNGVTVGAPTTVQNVNLAGYKVPLTAPFSASIGATYRVETPSGIFALTTNDRYNASYPMTPDGVLRQHRHNIVDASLNWTAPSKRYDINLFVRNLTNAYVYANAAESLNFSFIPGAPRTFGATLGVHF